MSTPLLRIDATPWSPWVVYGKENDSAVRGISMEIFQAMRQKRIFDYEIRSEKLFGGTPLNGKWTGLVGAMIDNLTDIGGPIYVSEERASMVHFSSPLGFCKLGILSGMVPANKNPFLVFGIFSVPVWLFMLLSIFLGASAACLIYSVLPSTNKKKRMEAFVKLLWIFEASLLGKEFGANSKFFLRHIWEAPSFKFLQGMWILSCLVLTYSYQGAIISTYAAGKMKPKYETLDDLMADPSVTIGTHANSYPLICFEKLANTEYDAIWKRVQRRIVKHFIDIPTYLDAVEEGKVAYVFDYGLTKHIIGQRFKQTGKCGLRVTAIDFCGNSIGIVMRKGLPKNTIRKFNDGIMRFYEGALQNIYFTETYLFYDICTSHATSATKPLGLSDLIGAFTVLGFGLAMSLLCFVLEITIDRRKKSRRMS